MDRISVMHLIHTLAYGGVETAVINWVRKLDRSRFDVHLVCFANTGGTESPFVEAAQRQGLEVLKIPWGRRKPVLKATQALKQLVIEHDVDILHTHNEYANLVGALTARLTPVKTITTLYVWHDFEWTDRFGFKRNVLQAMDKYVIRSLDQISVHCDATLCKAVKRGLPAERLTKLVSGFEADAVEMSAGERSARRREMGVADDQVVLLNVARLHPEKAHSSLLRSFEQIVQRAPRAHLWIAGVGPLEAELKAQRDRLGLDSKVSFLGFVDDLPHLLRLADIQVHPAEIEGIPLAICAGMAAELPIVASRVGGLPEVITHDRTGLLVPPGDEPAFVEAVLELIGDPMKRRRVGAAARRFIVTEYSLDAAVDRVERTYDRLLDRCA